MPRRRANQRGYRPGRPGVLRLLGRLFEDISVRRMLFSLCVRSLRLRFRLCGRFGFRFLLASVYKRAVRFKTDEAAVAHRCGICDMDKLPDEIIQHIFCFLDPCARYVFAQTCRQIRNTYPVWNLGEDTTPLVERNPKGSSSIIRATRPICASCCFRTRVSESRHPGIECRGCSRTQTYAFSMHKAASTYIKENGVRCHVCLQEPALVIYNKACRMCLLCNQAFCCTHQKAVEREYTIPYYALEDEDTVEGDPFFVCEIDHEKHYNSHTGPGVYKSMSHWRSIKGEEIIRVFQESRRRTQSRRA